MGNKSRDFPKNSIQELKDTISKLKSQIRHLIKENERLRHKNRTLDKAWRKTEEYLEDETKDKSLEQILEEVSLKEQKRKGIKKEEKIGKNEEHEKARLKWKKWREDNL